MGSRRDGQEGKAAGIDFLDFVFTVAFSLGLTPEILNIPHFKGVLSEEWVAQGRCPMSGEWFPTLTLALGFLTLVLSWFGYHASIQRLPLRYETTSGLFRFLLDVLLVALYAVIMLQFRRFDVVLALLVVVYVLYVVWDVLKILEHRDKSHDTSARFVARHRRELVTVFWCLVFIVLALVHRSGWISEWLVLCLAILSTALYRVNKNHRIWEHLFGIPHG